MEIDNDRRASLAKVILISGPFVLLLGSGLLAIFLLIHTWIPTIISGILVILGWGITVMLRLKSVKFRFSDDTISVLYYPISPMTSNFKRIDIASNKLVKFEIRVSLMGLSKELILYEDLDGQIATYKPVSLALCDEDTISRIEQELRNRTRLG